jgi:hypothetical protein
MTDIFCAGVMFTAAGPLVGFVLLSILAVDPNRTHHGEQMRRAAPFSHPLRDSGPPETVELLYGKAAATFDQTLPEAQTPH